VRWSRLWSWLQFVLALAGSITFLVYLLTNPLEPPTEPVKRVAPPPEVVTIRGPNCIHIAPGSLLAQKIEVVPVRKVVLSEPILTVTGRVVASLRPGNGKGRDFWQFDSNEMLTAYTDWQKAIADIAFNERQLELVQQLAQARLEAQRQVVRRLEKLVEAGTDAVNNLAVERAQLLQMEISERREIHQAEIALHASRREEAIQVRRLQQTGLDPELLRSAASDIDIVLAEVPEGWLHQIKIGQGCRARFFGLPKETFTGRVKRIAPMLSAERRLLRVLFTIDDPADKLRPGMFAEIGLGTDPRESLLVPAEAVLHIGRSDYVLVAGEDNTWLVTEVQLGEPYGNDIQVLSGVAEGMRVIGQKTILFKPLAIRALQLGESQP
jgi:multidrug efflux pump subunit AcrA (membrane-fusion protein)